MAPAAQLEFVGECARHPGRDRPALLCRDCLPTEYPHREDRLRLIETWRSMIGVPWEHCGRSRVGIDCVGVFLLAAQEMGWTMRPCPRYEFGIEGDPMQALLDERAVRVPAELALPGDVAWLRIRTLGCHLAGLTDSGTLIHALYRAERHVQVGSVQETTLSRLWADRTLQVYRYPELVHG